MRTQQTYMVERHARRGAFWQADVYTAQGAYIGTASGWTKQGRDEKIQALIVKAERNG